MMRSTTSYPSYPTVPNTRTMNCLSCLKDISRYRKRTTCCNCYSNKYCSRCMINGWCKTCYTTRKVVCPLCKHQVDSSGQRNICIKCDIGYCNDCGIDSFCRDCYIENEKQELVTCIAKCRKDICVSSISIIASYCIGYVITCCNDRECTNTIIFNNKYEFLVCSEYKYFPKINLKNSMKIYGRNTRIFCMECTANKMEPCLNIFGGKCMNLEICGDNKYGNICGDHPVCYNCNQQELKREPRCPQVHALREGLRRWVYYTAKSTKIKQCAICKHDFCKDCIFYNGLFCKKCGDEYNEIINVNKRNLQQLSIGNGNYDRTSNPKKCPEIQINQPKTTKKNNYTRNLDPSYTNQKYTDYYQMDTELLYEELQNNICHNIQQPQVPMMDTKVTKNEPLGFQGSTLNNSWNNHSQYHGIVEYNYTHNQSSMYDCNLSLSLSASSTQMQPAQQQQQPQQLPLFSVIRSNSVKSLSSLGSPPSICYDNSWCSNTSASKSMTPNSLGSPTSMVNKNECQMKQIQDSNIVSLGNQIATVIDLCWDL